MHLMFMPIFGAFEVFLPIFCGDRLGQVDYYTLVSSAVGAGLALGSLVTYRLLGRFKPLNLVFASFLGYAAGMLLLTESTMLVLALLVCFLLGMIDAFGFTTYEYLRQRVVPAAYRGRVFAVMDAVSLLPMPLGYLAVGYFAERTSIVTIGVWLSVIGLLLALFCFPLTRGLPELQEQLGG
jgi:predicted MFS family arabinose efflux permease